MIEERPEDEDDQEAEKKETADQPEEEAQPELADTPLRESALDDEMAVFARTPFFEYSGHTADVLDVSWSKVIKQMYQGYSSMLNDWDSV